MRFSAFDKQKIIQMAYRHRNQEVVIGNMYILFVVTSEQLIMNKQGGDECDFVLFVL